MILGKLVKLSLSWFLYLENGDSTVYLFMIDITIALVPCIPGGGGTWFPCRKETNQPSDHSAVPLQRGEAKGDKGGKRSKKRRNLGKPLRL